MSEHICPQCGTTKFDDECVWLYRSKFYCSEACCRKAAARG